MSITAVFSPHFISSSIHSIHDLLLPAMATIQFPGKEDCSTLIYPFQRAFISYTVGIHLAEIVQSIKQTPRPSSLVTFAPLIVYASIGGYLFISGHSEHSRKSISYPVIHTFNQYYATLASMIGLIAQTTLSYGKMRNTKEIVLNLALRCFILAFAFRGDQQYIGKIKQETVHKQKWNAMKQKAAAAVTYVGSIRLLKDTGDIDSVAQTTGNKHIYRYYVRLAQQQVPYLEESISQQKRVIRIIELAKTNAVFRCSLCKAILRLRCLDSGSYTRCDLDDILDFASRFEPDLNSSYNESLLKKIFMMEPKVRLQ